MKRDELVRRLGELLMAKPGQCLESTRLESLPGWDSMGQVATIALLDEELRESPPAGVLQKCEAIGDIVRLVEGKLEA